MVDIHSARQDAKYIRNAGYGTAATIIEELCDEVKELASANEWLKAQRILDNHEAARLYDFSRDKGAALERAAVVAWLREEPEKLVACSGHRHADGKPCFVMSPMPASELADAIERGEHRREEEP